MSGAIPLFPYMPCWLVETTFTFTVTMHSSNAVSYLVRREGLATRGPWAGSRRCRIAGRIRRVLVLCARLWQGGLLLLLGLGWLLLLLLLLLLWLGTRLLLLGKTSSGSGSPGACSRAAQILRLASPRDCTLKKETSLL